jgi:hypothetical protein
MADTKFSALPAASALSGSEKVIGLQGAAATQVGVQAIVDLPSTTKAVTGEIAGVNTQAGTAYTLTAADKGCLVIATNASAVTITVPLGIFKKNAVVYIKQSGAGQVTMAAASGVTLETEVSLKTRAVRGVLALIFHADDAATVVGAMA